MIACGVGAIGAGLCVTAMPSLSGCYTHQCDPSSVTFDGGDMADLDTYETSSLGGPWLGYPPNVTLTVQYLPIVGANRTPVSIEGYIGNSPPDAGINFTTAAGNVIEYGALDGTGFRVLNSTCQFYWARFVVHFAHEDAGDAALAEAAPGDAAPGDAALGDDAGEAASADAVLADGGE